MSGLDVLVRLEWLAVFVASLVAYGVLGFSWLWFAVLILVPDLSMLGYLAGPRVGAFCYNVVHTLLLAAAAAGFAWVLGIPWLYGLSLILLAHIAGDRALGYGLKYATGFGETHVGRIGKAQA